MALVLADRVLETTTSTGSGTITLAGAEPGYQSFAVVGNTNQTYYTIAGDTEWEVGIGTYTSSGTTLSRDTVLSSSASGAKVTFSAGQKKVFVTYPSEKSVNFDVSGNISVSSAIITNVAEPIVGSDAATKLYVDTLAAQGISYHEPVKYEVPNTTGNLVATYNQPGGAGVGVSATLTNAGSLVPFIPDGVTASISDRVLVYNQTNAFENGVYTVTVVGDGSTAWVLTRAADADTYGVKSPTELGGGDAFFVTSGNTGAGETYICNNASVIIFGSTAITFAQISSAQVYQAGNGISLTNTTISLATPVSVANGGTGQSTAPSNGQLLIGNGVSFVLSTLTAGSGVSITNSAGSITLSATNSGAVTSVTATGPLASSGGQTPDISIANSTGTGSVVLDQGATISSATITAAVSASITTITGTSANITTVTGTTAGFSSANITQLGTTSATIATLSGTNVTYSSGTVSQLAATSATIASVSGTNVTYSNGNLTSATVTTISGTTATYTSATVTNLALTSLTLANLNIASANITTLTGTTFGTTATTHLRAASADITTLTGTTFGTTLTTQLRGASAAITNISATSLTVTNTIAGSITGNAGTATLLQNARTINGTSFNGGANITITANTTNSVTFNNGGAGGASGSTFNGSGALTVSYNTVGAALGYGNLGTTNLNTVITSGMYRFDVPSANSPGFSYGQLIVARGAGDTITQIAGDFATGSLSTRSGNPPDVGGGGSWTPWRVVLSSNNYNSYAPTLTGTGASGTWGISITGNAATATNASYAYNYTQSFASNWNTDFQNTPAGSTKLAGDTSTGSTANGPGGVWWFQQNMRHTNGSNYWGVQVAWGWEDNANILRTRNVTANSFGAWVTYLNSANYTSYISGSKLQSQTFTGSGTFTVPSGVTSVWVTMIGGGSGGGASAYGNGAGGGGGGAYMVKRAVNVTPGSGVAVTIGGGGAGHPADSQGSGSEGGTTSFGSISCAGSQIGGGIGQQVNSQAGAGGTVGGARQYTFPAGSAGGRVGRNITSGVNYGSGAGGLYGNGGNASDAYGESASANSGGGGGAGGYGGGGNGGSGIVIVEWLA